MGKYIGTISGNQWSWGAIKQVLDGLDCKEYVIGEEVGKGGYNHYQFAVHCSGDLEQYTVENSLGWHVEVATDFGRAKMYCRKDGRVHEFADSIEFREYIRIRTRPLRTIQQDILSSLDSQNDRQITVWIDRVGGIGKSTLLYLMARRGQVFPVPRAEQKAARIMDYVAMNYEGEEIIALDLPRKAKLTAELSEVLEDLKDGLVASAKYQGTVKFIRGVKILVYTNQYIPKEVYMSLTGDRWDIHLNRDPREENPTVTLDSPPFRGGGE